MIGPNPTSPDPNASFLTSPSLGGMPEPSPEQPPDFLPPPEPVDEGIPRDWLEDPPVEFQDEAFKYFSRCLKASRNYVLTNVADYQQALALYRNAVKLSEFETGGTKLPKQAGSGSASRPPKPEWQSEYLHPIGPAVRQFAAQGYKQIFLGPDWLVVSNEAPNSFTDGTGYDDAQRMQKLLLHLLGEGGIYRTVFRSLLHLKLLPAVYAKARWEERTVTKRFMDMEGQWQRREEKITDHPVVDLVPLDQILPDPRATTDNIDEWDFIGDVAHISTDELYYSFVEGRYGLNEEEATRRWIDNGGSSDPLPLSQMGSDANSGNGYVVVAGTSTPTDQADDRRFVRRWEVHGLVPSKSMKSRVECCATIITDADSDTPEDGLLVRLTTEPVLASGRRPYASAQWTPLEGKPFGISHPTEIKETQHQKSQLVAILVDNAKITALPRMIAEGPDAARALKKEGANELGAVITVQDRNSIQPLAPPQAPTDTLLNSIKLFDQQIQLHDSQDAYLGLATNDTATGASIQQQQASAPADATLDLFSRDFLERICDLAIDFIKTKTSQDRSVPIPGKTGNSYTTLTIPVQVIQNGKFKVRITLTNQNASKIALAQTLQRLIQDSVNVLPVMQMQGSQVIIEELYKRQLDCLGIDGTERVITPFQPPPPPPQMTDPNAPPPDDGMGGAPPDAGWAQPPEFLTNGGPMGESTDDINAMAQYFQMTAPGGQGEWG